MTRNGTWFSRRARVEHARDVLALETRGRLGLADENAR